jgi:hypothetical protein
MPPPGGTRGDVDCEVGLVSLNRARFADCCESFSGIAIGFTGLYLGNNFDQTRLALQQRMSAVTAR